MYSDVGLQVPVGELVSVNYTLESVGWRICIVDANFRTQSLSHIGEAKIVGTNWTLQRSQRSIKRHNNAIMSIPNSTSCDNFFSTHWNINYVLILVVLL